jgi:hypothetical protein
MTSAQATPRTGFWTTWDVYDSHLPLVEDTSSLPSDTRALIKVEWPMVPTIMIGSEVLFVRPVATVPLTYMVQSAWRKAIGVVVLTYPNHSSKIPRNILRSPRNTNTLITRNNNRRSNTLIRQLELALIEL